MAKEHLGRGGSARRVDPGTRRQQAAVDDILDALDDFHGKTSLHFLDGHGSNTV
ncbi:hypothetical protein [Desulfosarcina cetonica]|uniref:hypothetical protein n=1 Tax=Desulfosarcina cetonica TaxID=90730 RepID=UPI001C4557E0|nr:hypothetical protein [Desulfosarcina cetonica]